MTIGMPSMPTAERYQFPPQVANSLKIKATLPTSPIRERILARFESSDPGLRLPIPLAEISETFRSSVQTPVVTSAPVSLTPVMGVPAETVPLSVHMELTQQHQRLSEQYIELFISRETILHAREAPEPVVPYVGGVRGAREFQMKVVR